MLVVISDDREAVDGVVVPVCSQTTLLNGLRSVFALGLARDGVFLCSNIPFKQVTGHGRANNNVGLVRIEHGLRDLVLAVQSQLGTTLQTDTENIDLTIRLVHIKVTTLAVRSEQEFGL